MQQMFPLLRTRSQSVKLSTEMGNESEAKKTGVFLFRVQTNTKFGEKEASVGSTGREQTLGDQIPKLHIQRKYLEMRTKDDKCYVHRL